MNRAHDIFSEQERAFQNRKADESVGWQTPQFSIAPRPSIASERDVKMAYRLILGREPENPAVVQKLLEKKLSFSEIRDIFIRSPEFRDNVIGCIGGALKPLDWDANDIETVVDDTNLTLLYAHVKDVWSNLGATEPHYSVLTFKQFKSNAFREHAEEFYASGSKNLQVFQNTLQRNSIDIAQFKDCFELGCGVGRVTLKLAEIFRKVIAADVSASHLRLARSALISSAHNVVEFRRLETIESLDVLPNFDVFYSIIVLQHNPPPVIGVMLKKILSKLRDGGIGYFQVPTYALGYRFDCKTYLQDIKSKAGMEMHVFPQQELFELVRGQHCRVIEVREDNYVGNRNIISNSILVMK